MHSGVWRAAAYGRKVGQGLALGLVVALALATVTLAVLAAFGAVPWLELSARFGDMPIPQAGMWAQITFTLLMVMLCFYLPSHARIFQLEKSHRDFNVRMEDVARAYRESHATDRAGVFALSGEFDSVRDRIKHLREHPELSRLEPEILELASQMSHHSRDLARIYSDEKVQRARSFLKQRQEEIDAYRETIALARTTCDELKRWVQEVSVEDAVVEAQMDALEADLADLLPALGYDIQPPGEEDSKVVPIQAKPKD